MVSKVSLISKLKPAVLFLFLGALSAFTSQYAHAHPHEFVTMRVEVKFNDEGKLSGFQYFWQFDEFFSAYAIEGQDKNKNGKADQEELDALIVEILGNIEPAGYFTAFDGNHLTPKLGTAEPVKVSYSNRQLELTFNVPFKNPVSLKKNTMRYAIYDSQFYIAMHHDPDDVPVFLVNPPKGCSWKLDEAAPDEDTVAYASSLGKSDSSGFDLGAQFAEWVSISCK